MLNQFLIRALAEKALAGRGGLENPVGGGLAEPVEGATGYLIVHPLRRGSNDLEFLEKDFDPLRNIEFVEVK